MPSIKAIRFGGMIPAVRSRNLPEPYAEEVTNARLWDTTLRPFSGLSNPDTGCLVAKCRNESNCAVDGFRTIYRSKDSLYGWCGDVCVVEGQPFYDDDVLILFEASVSDYLPAAYNYLWRGNLISFGIPHRPITAPTAVVTASNGSATIGTEVIEYDVPQIEVDEYDYVGGLGNIDPNIDPQDPTVIRGLIDNGNVHVSKDIGPSYQQAFTPMRQPVAFMYTYVNLMGDESAPSPPLYYGDMFSRDRFRVCDFALPLASDNVQSIRVYATNTPLVKGDEADPPMDVEWFMVGEIPIAESCLYSEMDIACWQGDLLLTMDHCPPWPCMHCVVELELGALVGWCECNVYWSERHLYGAWRAENEITLLAQIKKAVAFYDTLFVATTRNPYRINYSVTKEGQVIGNVTPYQEHYPILAPESMVVSNFGAIYSCSEGLVALLEDAARLITRNIINPDTWVKDFAPDIAAWHQGIYYGFRRGTTEGFAFDFPDSASGQFDKAELIRIHLPEPIYSVHSGKDGHLYMGLGDGVYVWDNDGKWVQPYDYLSKLYVMPGLTSWSVAKVVGDYSAGSVTFELLASGEVKYTRVVSTSEPFRLPNCGNYVEWQYRLTGKGTVFEVHLATSMSELIE